MAKCGKILTTAAVLCGIAGIATAEGKSFIMTGGIICDELTELTQLTDSVGEHGNLQKAIAELPGCGVLTKPLPAVAHEMPPYENKKVRVFIIRVEFPTVGLVQYSYTGFEMKDKQETNEQPA